MDAERRIEFWFTMGSTYTYLTVMRLDELARSAGVRFVWKPFDRRAVGNNVPFPEGSSKTAYMWRDLERRAAKYRIPIQLPVPYPAKETELANRVALIGVQEGWGPAFARAAYLRWFQRGQETGSEPNLSDSLREVGQEPRHIRDLAISKEVNGLWNTQSDRARVLGLFGSPSFVVGTEVFWGDDRLEDAISWRGGFEGVPR